MARVTVTARRLLAAFLLGAVCGGAATVPLYGQQVETLRLQTGRLLQTLSEYRSRLEKLESSNRDHPQAHVIEEVTLELLWPDEAVRLALVERLAPLTRELVGREVAALDPYLVYAVFDGRAVELESGRYRLRVRALVVAGETIIILGVEEETEEPPAIGEA